MDENGAVKRSVRIRDHLLKEYQEAQPLRAARAESTAPTEPAR